MPPYRGGPTDLMDTDISFPLARLFDEYNLDHIQEERRMELFEHRDLPHVKHYKAAVKIFGGPLSRKRVIIAPPMETPMKHRLGLYHNRQEPPPPPVMNSELKPPVHIDKLEYDPKEIQAEIEKDKEFQYKKWIQERQKFRNNLENMGLSEDWLAKKPDKTALEKRVLRRMKEERMPKDIESPPPSETPISTDVKSVPIVLIPSPLGIRILELFLKKNKMRLIDLFTQTDKDKNWKLSRNEFRESIRKSRVPLSEALLEDLILSLDMDFDDNLDYKELARGLDQWKKEKRINRRKQLSRESTSVSSKGSGSSSGTPIPFPETAHDREITELMRKDDKGSSHAKSQKSSAKSKSTKNTIDGSLGQRTGSIEQINTEKENSVVEKEAGEVKKRTDSAKESGHESSRTQQSQSRSSTPQYLHPPDPDKRPERLILQSEEAMVDLRKRDREALKGAALTRKPSPKKPKDEAPGIIKVGEKAIDNHCMKSTLEGETSDMIDKFRQLKLREYYEITKMCQQQNILLNKSLLERVLLHPPDRPHGAIQRRVKTPGTPLLSSHYAEPPKRPRTPIEIKHKDKVRRSKSGKLLIDSRHKYPQRKSVAPTGTKENLSTGRAVIRRRVDCWMTFEEYERYTSHLAIRYQQMHGTTNENAFWPGHLLDKLRLCMPPYDNPELADQSEILFSSVKKEKSIYPGKQRENGAWPLNDHGMYQSGIYDPYARKYGP